MKTCGGLIAIAVMLFSFPLGDAHSSPEDAPPAGMEPRFDRVQVPFIENKGQIPNKDASYFAKLLQGYMYVEKNGMLTYNFSSADNNPIVINELFTEKPGPLVPLEPPPEFAMEVFRQKGQISGDIGNYYRLSYGRIHENIELQLLAFMDGLEKIFTVAPGGDPHTITVTVKGVKALKVNDAGALELQTAHGPVTFPHPWAYQLTGEEMKPVEISFVVRNTTAYGFKLGRYDKTKKLIIGPLLPPALRSAIQ